MNPIYVDIRPLGRGHDRTSLDCGEPALDEFFRRNARQNEDRGISRTYVATARGESRVLGFYSLAAGSVPVGDLPETERRRLPRYPIPAVKLARLAVDRSAQGGGVGKALLADALRRSVRVAEIIGIFAVEVYAKQDAAAAFYHRFGFAPLQDDRLHLYLPIPTARTLIESS
ncbi:MAG: GNAT family N-acetyltransferase [Gemmatimonadetes bacterium]|nr:GNAT family N-acetyltransferase [Gemmatimonadota bacterium]